MSFPGLNWSQKALINIPPYESPLKHCGRFLEKCTNLSNFLFSSVSTIAGSAQQHIKTLAKLSLEQGTLFYIFLEFFVSVTLWLLCLHSDRRALPNGCGRHSIVVWRTWGLTRKTISSFLLSFFHSSSSKVASNTHSDFITP